VQQQGMIDAKGLEELADAGEIDTVLCMFTDFQGRFVGKRILPQFFLEEVMGEEGLHACLYLIAIDMEMEPLPGFEYASWETGYGDFKMIPDLGTMRLVPWLEKTAMVICDVADEHTSELVEVAPRTILRRQVERAKSAGYTFKTGSELEFYLFKESYDEAAGKRYHDLQPTSPYIMDYHMLATTKDEWLIRQIRNGMVGAGIPIEFSKGEFGRGQHEINITYADALATADYHALYKHGVKEIAALNGAAITFMAKWTMDEAGSSCHLHSSVWNEDGSESLMWDDADPNHMTQTFKHMLGGLMSTAREMSWMYAPFVNSYILWSHDNRTCGFRIVGEHAGNRVESRLPGADMNPYLGTAATIAAGLHGIQDQVECPPLFEGNAYESKDAERVPSSLHEAIAEMERSEMMREAFGDFVFGHLVNMARQEQIIFDNQTVTDWELIRYFERG
jgi:glutamine synthetase